MFRNSIVRVALILLKPFIKMKGTAHNNAKILEAKEIAKPLIFSYLMCILGRDFDELLRGTTGPFDGDAVD